MGKKTYLNIMIGDTDVNDCLICENPTSDAIVYKISRDNLATMKAEENLKQCGIYFLFGHDNEKQAVYIGQANMRKNRKGVLGRVMEHNKPKDAFWDTAFIAVSRTDSIGATELNYLENQCCNKAIDADSYKIINAIDPAIGKYDTRTEYVMNAFIDEVSTVFTVLGYKLFTSQKKRINVSETERLYIKRSSNNPKRSCDAACIRRDDGYVVLAGSKLCLEPTPSCQNGIRKQRENNKKNIDRSGILRIDISFSSPSTASSFVLYASSNGKAEWKNKEGIPLGEIIDK